MGKLERREATSNPPVKIVFNQTNNKKEKKKTFNRQHILRKYLLGQAPRRRLRLREKGRNLKRHPRLLLTRPSI